ncbi:MAG: MFS transporter [Sphingomonas sp.]
MGTGTDPPIEPAHPRWRHAALRPLAVPVFRRFWIASMVSNFGTMMHGVAAAWLMTSLSTGVEMVAMVQTAATLPMMLFSVPAGALADIVDRRRIMIYAQVGMALVTTTLCLTTVGGWTTPAVLLAATFLVATGNALYAPAWQASVAEQVSLRLLDSATSLTSVGFNVARSIGPAIGGLLVATVGSGPVFGLNALSNIGIVAASLSWRREPSEPPLPPEGMREAVAAGLRYASLSPRLITLLVRSSSFGFCGSCVWALTPVLSRDALGGGPISLGLLLGGFGLGAIFGAVLRTNLSISIATLLGRCTLIAGAATIALSLSPSTWLAIPLMALNGACWIMVLTSLSVSVQMIVPRWVVGRMISINQMSVFAGMAGGSLLWGVVARHAGVRYAFFAAGAAMVASLVLQRWFPLWSATNLDLTPRRTTPIDTLEGPVAATEGPIVITIEYRVPPASAGDFMEAMEALGRVRRRDGAKRWSLQQDLEDGERWVERFVSASWISHLRRQMRPTFADQETSDRVAALHLGPPVVRRAIERSRNAPAASSYRVPDY